MNSTTLPLNKEAQRFRQNEEAVTALGDALNNIMLRRAIAIVKTLATPRLLPDVTPGVHHDTTIAHHMHFLMGVNKAFDTLHKLATSAADELDEDNDPEREEFADYASEHKIVSKPVQPTK